MSQRHQDARILPQISFLYPFFKVKRAKPLILRGKDLRGVSAERARSCCLSSFSGIITGEKKLG